MDGKGKTIRNYIVMAVLFIVAAACIIGMMAYLSMNRGMYEVNDFSDGWTVDYCGRHYENISKSDNNLGRIRTKKNDVLVMTRRIDATGADRLTVRVYSRLSSLRVSIIDRVGNEKEVYFYGYGADGIRNGDFLGSGYHFVELPQESYGKTLKIMEMGSQDGALQGIPDVVVTSFDDAMPAFIQTRAFSFFVTVFMFLIGCVIILFSLFIAVFDRDFFTLTFLGLFSVSSGLWCMCSSKTIEIFSRNIRLDGFIEYMSLYIFIIPLLILALYSFKNIPVWQKAMMFASICAAIGLDLAAVVLQRRGLANIDFVLPLFHMLLAIDAVFLIVVSAMHWRQSGTAEKFFESGIFAAAIAGILYILIYYVSTKSHLDSGILDLVLVPAAFFLMTLLILIGYIAGMFERRGEAVQKERLHATSGNDDLTGLRDNIIGESVLRRLSLDDRDYLIINFDLNRIGQVNITHGNLTGDMFIRSFSSILKGIFSDADLLCRMGGDEFFVVYEKKILSVQELDDRFERLEAEERDITSEIGTDIPLQASYGYAFSTEVKEKDTRLAYQLANQRMYRMKLDRKNGRASS